MSLWSIGIWLLLCTGTVLKVTAHFFFQHNSRKTWWIIVKHDWLGGDFQRHRCLMPISYQWNVGAWLLFVFESLLPRYIKSLRQSYLSELEMTFHIFKRGWNLWKIKRDSLAASSVRKVGNSARDLENLVAGNSYWNSKNYKIHKTGRYDLQGKYLGTKSV